MKDRFLVTGPCGQDGRILIDRLTLEGNLVCAIVRSENEKQFLKKYAPNCLAFIGNLNNEVDVKRIIKEFEPTVIFHLAAKSSVAESWNNPELIFKTNVEATSILLEIYKSCTSIETKFYFSSSSEMFGSLESNPQNEMTRMNPLSPYGKSKFESFNLVKKMRESSNRFLVSGILYNHESPIRDPRFVTRKITQGVAKISQGLQDWLILGDLSVIRDWGWAPDYVDGILKMLANHEPKDYLLATGRPHSLEYFVQKAFMLIGIYDWEKYVKSERKLFRDSEIMSLSGDSSRAQEELGWKTEKSLDFIISKMLEQDIKILKNDAEDGFWKATDS